MREGEKDALRVLAVQGDAAKEVQEGAKSSGHLLDSAIRKAEGVLGDRSINLPEYSLATARGTNARQIPALRSWNELVAEAEAARPGEIGLQDLLSADEIQLVDSRLDGWGKEFRNLHKLTSYDYAVAGIAGILAGLADIFLVKVPAHEGFLGGPASEGGWLSNRVNDLLAQILPDEKIREFEILYKVPYDATTSDKLDVKIPNLSPRSHRLHSLGHDPILGWIFGVWDIFNGSMTTIGGDGRLVTQAIMGQVPVKVGWDVFAKIIEALKTVGGHLGSDVATPAGLPPPLFVLLQFLQVGDVKGRTIAEMSRAMYRSGYDFRHFLAGGVCVALIETIVRVAWFARERHEGKSFKEAIPVGNRPRLHSGLFLAHSAAAAVNAGKVIISKNPLSLNWAQWLAFFRYLVPQVHWFLVNKENARHRFVHAKLKEGWNELDESLSKHFFVQDNNKIRL